jgi:hypothetical protein
LAKSTDLVLASSGLGQMEAREDKGVDQASSGDAGTASGELEAAF